MKILKTARNVFIPLFFAITALLFSFPFIKVAGLKASVSTALQTLEELRTADPSDIAALEKFDGRDYGIITPVKDQGDSNLCWAYASVNASEASILLSGIDPSADKDNLSLSPEALAYRRHNRDADPLKNTDRLLSADYQNWYTKSGDPSYGADVFSQWCGPIANSKAVTSDPYEHAEYRMENAVFIDYDRVSDEKIAAIKRAVAQYGAVTYSYNNMRETEYYNPKNETGSGSSPHACTIIGWDDTIPASRFVPNGATRDGGWLIKNSYNSLPYFYLSYDNNSSSVYAFDYAAKDDYDFDYFYDNEKNNALTPSKYTVKAANVFEAKKGENGKAEFVHAVNIGLQGKNVSCTVKIYTDLTDETNPESGTLSGIGNAVFDYAGYRTVKLDSPVKIEKGSLFGVVAEVSNPKNNAHIHWSQQISTLAKSHIFSSDGYWTKARYPVRIKAFTALSNDNLPPVEPEPNPPTEPDPIEPTQTDLSDCDLTVSGKFVYTGNAIEPTVTAALKGIALKKDVDYNVTYRDNTNAGTAVVTIVGTGKYCGSKSVNFIIEKVSSPAFVQTEVSVPKGAEHLSDVPLPEGWVWENPTATLTSGDMTVRAVYVGKDADNFMNTTKEIVLKVPFTETDEAKKEFVIPIAITAAIVLVAATLACVLILKRKSSLGK